MFCAISTRSRHTYTHVKVGKIDQKASCAEIMLCDERKMVLIELIIGNFQNSRSRLESNDFFGMLKSIQKNEKLVSLSMKLTQIYEN